MTKIKLFKNKNTLKVLKSLLSDPKTLKQLVTENHQDKLKTQEKAQITCPKCNKVNLKDLKATQDHIKFMHNDQTGKHHNLTCIHCGKRLFKKTIKPQYTSVTYQDIPDDFYRSHSGHITNILKELKELHMVKKEDGRWTVNYEGFYMFLPFWHYMTDGKVAILKIPKRPRPIDKQLAKTKINNLLRSYFLSRPDWSDINYLFFDFTRELATMGHISIKETDKDIEELKKLQFRCMQVFYQEALYEDVQNAFPLQRLYEQEFNNKPIPFFKI